MKIKMSYSLELGEVPFKVEEMAGACSSQLKTLSYSIASLDPTNTKQFLERIGSLRQKLFFIDNQLNDCVEIMEGYLSTLENYKHLDEGDPQFNMATKPEEQLAQPGHGPAGQMDLSALQENLHKMDELLQNE